MHTNKIIDGIKLNAHEKARERCHTLVTVEHLLLALLENWQVQLIMKEAGLDFNLLRGQLEIFFTSEICDTNNNGTNQIHTSPGIKKIFTVACKYMQARGANTLDVGDILLAIMDEKDYYANYYLAKQQIKRETIKELIDMERAKTCDPPTMQIKNVSLKDCDTLLNTGAYVLEEIEHSKMARGDAFTPFVKNIIKFDENKSSNILAMLFNPNGPHGQSMLFLRKFLGLLPFQKSKFIKASEVVRVEREKSTTGLRSASGHFRKMDIFIECYEFCIVIENKLFHATDGVDQINDYLKWLKGYCSPKPFLLVYIPPDESGPTLISLSKDVKSEYCDNFYILSWKVLNKALMETVEIVPPKIAYFVKDFCVAISKIIKPGEADMETQSGMVDFLAWQTSPEQLEAAYATWECYTKAADTMIDAWSQRLRSNLENLVKGKITVNEKYKNEWDYLAISYPEYNNVGVYVLSFKNGFYDIPANTVIWGIGVYLGNYGSRENAREHPWVKCLLKDFGMNDLTGYMINPVSCGSKTDPNFLIKIRESSPPYLYKEILYTCQRIEKLGEEFQFVDKGPDGAHPVTV